MRKCILYFVIVLEVGGGFMGFWSLFRSWLMDTSTPTPPFDLIFPIFIGALFLFGIAAGLAFVEKPQWGIAMSAVYQMLQIPILSSPVITYKLVSGLQLGIGCIEGKTAFMTEFGARCTFSILRRTDSWVVGINLLALALFVFLLLHLRPKAKAVFQHGN
jgi:hypothetical protein